MSNQMSISVLVIAIGITILVAVTPKVIFSQDLSVNDTQNMSAVSNQTMMMPGGKDRQFHLFLSRFTLQFSFGNDSCFHYIQKSGLIIFLQLVNFIYQEILCVIIE